MLIFTLGLVVMLSMSATAFAFNPQPEPPARMPEEVARTVGINYANAAVLGDAGRANAGGGGR